MKNRRKRFQRMVPFILLLGFLAVMIAGIGLGDVAEVILNATMLCLSCMGIG